MGQEIASAEVDFEVNNTETNRDENGETQSVAPETNDPADGGGNRRGCRSSVGFASVMVLTVLSVVCVAFRKKEQD